MKMYAFLFKSSYFLKLFTLHHILFTLNENECTFKVVTKASTTEIHFSNYKSDL